jgi:hypothetical protein
MITTDQIRIIEVLDNNIWVQAQLVQMEAGDIFRMTEPDGTRLTCALPDGSTTELFQATSQAQIGCEPFVLGGLPSAPPSTDQAPIDGLSSGADNAPISGS